MATGNWPREGGPAAIPANQRVGDLTNTRNLLDSQAPDSFARRAFDNGVEKVPAGMPAVASSTLHLGRADSLLGG